MAKHTEGPWTLVIDEIETTGPQHAPRRYWTIEKRKFSTEFLANYVPRYMFNGYIDNERDEADVRLIAAAPEMLEALKAARNEIARGGHIDRWKTVHVIDAAIAKAEGE